MGEKKIPKPVRKLNLGYKIIMSVLAGLSLIFSAFTEMDPIYYKVVSVFSSAFPVIWTQVLDACKTYEAEQTPTTTPKEGTPEAEEGTESAVDDAPEDSPEGDQVV